MEIFITRDGQQFGPYSPEDIKEHLAARAILAEDMAWHEGLSEWQALGTLIDTPARQVESLAVAEKKDHGRPQATSGYYTHSGCMPLWGLPVMVGMSLFCVALFGLVYAYITVYIPFVYVRFLFTIAYGAAMGLVIWTGARLGNVRNTMAFWLTLIPIGLFAVYITWVFWLFAMTKQQAFVVFPTSILVIMQKLAETGVWSIRDITPAGFSLYAIWLIEAGIIAGLAIWVGWRRFKITPFCEQCTRWVSDMLTIEPLGAVINPDWLRSSVEQGNFGLLMGLQKERVGTTDFTRVSLLHCPGCKTLHLLTVTSVSITANSKGELEEKETSVLENLLISEPAYEYLKRLEAKKA